MTGENYVAFFDLSKILLLLSHGQASVEWGFSVNKEIEVENLLKHSLVAQRTICDYGQQRRKLLIGKQILLFSTLGKV